jgi:hypothetical protein
MAAKEKEAIFPRKRAPLLSISRSEMKEDPREGAVKK